MCSKAVWSGEELALEELKRQAVSLVSHDALEVKVELETARAVFSGSVDKHTALRAIARLLRGTATKSALPLRRGERVCWVERWRIASALPGHAPAARRAGGRPVGRGQAARCERAQDRR